MIYLPGQQQPFRMHSIVQHTHLYVPTNQHPYIPLVIMISDRN